MWYLPHHGVINENKPGKISVVFDGSCKFQGHSLNQYLLQGPDLNNTLVGVLTRFRLAPVAISCDIARCTSNFESVHPTETTYASSGLTPQTRHSRSIV